MFLGTAPMRPRRRAALGGACKVPRAQAAATSESVPAEALGLLAGPEPPTLPLRSSEPPKPAPWLRAAQRQHLSRLGVGIPQQPGARVGL